MSHSLSSPHHRKRLRSQLRASRMALSAEQRLSAAEAVATHLATFPAARSPGYVGGYWASGGELPLHVVHMRLLAGQVWCLPVIQADGSLRFAPWRPGDPLENNRFGIPEPTHAESSLLSPTQMSLVLLPLLGFDRHGQRLGAGGGYYDRSFAFRQQTTAPPTLIGIGYACQELADIPAEPWDVPMDAIATEVGIIVPDHPTCGR